MTGADVRHRFPGVRDGWARFDGPAGTQMVDVAIRAASEWSASGNNANTHGAFAAANATDDLLERARGVVAQLLDADPQGVVFGANMTTLTFAFTRAVARTLQPGDRVVGTRLDHDANVSPWRIACEESGAEHVLAPFSTVDGRLDMDALAALITPNTKWVAVTGASNLIGTMPDVKAVVTLAHRVGARVFVDAVHLAPHMPVSVRDIGCDVLATSPYKWYGPHAGVLCVEPNLLNALPIAKVRPADDIGPRRFETGTPNFENIAATEAKRQQASAVLTVARREVERRVVSASRGYDSRLAELAHWRSDVVSQFESAAELADRHYRLGAVPATIYVELQKQYLDAVEAHLDTRREALAALLELEQATGLNLIRASSTQPARP